MHVKSDRGALFRRRALEAESKAFVAKTKESCRAWMIVARDWNRMAEKEGPKIYAVPEADLVPELRNDLPHVFLRGTYQGLEVVGRDADRVVAFGRHYGRDRIVVAVGRHFAEMTDGGRHWPRGWQGSIQFEAGDYTDKIGSVTGPVTAEIATLFANIPVAVIARGP